MLLLLACAPDDPAPETPTLTADGASVAYTWSGGSVTLDGEAEGEGTFSVTFAVVGDTVVPTVSSVDGGVLEGVTLRGGWSMAGEPVLWRQGYQSWSWSGVTELLPTLDTAIDGDGDVQTIAAETAGTSWWAGLVGVPDGDSLLLGVTSTERTKFYTAWSTTEVAAVWGTRGERITLAPGATVTLDPLWIGTDTSAHALWTTWAEQVRARPIGRTWVGWSDWYQYYGSASEADILAELAAAPPLDLFQVDDGWEVAWGDWEANDRFPSGTAALATAIADRGMTPGLWMAPFYVARSTTTYAEHPDWWVRDADGEVRHGSLSGNDYAILDVTHPDAAAWLSAQIAAKVAEGWTYLKLDFLFAGAVEGVRHDDVTGMEAYHRGLALLRDAMGEDTWFLACGAPMLPSVGYADSWRSGADIAFVSDPDPRRPFLRWQARSTAARAFANGVWWWNDADNLLLRAPFTDVEVRGALAANVASGGVWLLGDSFAALDADTLALAVDPALTALSGQRAEPVDPLDYVSGVDAGPFMEASTEDDEVPEVWTVGDVTVLLNLENGARTVSGPGGEELLTGETAGAGERTLEAGGGEVWR
jgi:alpha-galactosidase